MSALPPIAAPILEGLYQHRLLSTGQIRELYAPGTRVRWTQRVLAALRDAGLADAVPARQGLRLWFVTEQGADAVEAVATRLEQRRKLTRPAQAAGPLRHHTVA